MAASSRVTTDGLFGAPLQSGTVFLNSLADFYDSFKGPHSLILLGHCLWCAYAFRSNSVGLVQRYVLGFWIVFLGSFGGGVVTSLLMQRPDVVPNPAFSDARILPYTLAAWYLVQYTSIGDMFSAVWPLRMLCRFASTFCRASLICQRTDAAAKLFPGVPGAALLLGTLAGTGGKLLTEYILHHLGHLNHPSEVTLPSYALRSGFIGAGTYLVSVYLLPPESQLNTAQGKAVVITVLLLQTLVSTLWGREVDITAPFKATFHAVTGIPEYTGEHPQPPKPQQPPAAQQQRKQKDRAEKKKQ
uniref:Uncharacterized protein n=1 Tax=Tetraselmis sp. GSL018 TaxID=582737 RepID=A0A061RI31_9CHLO|mmetsp:Transcript_21034/g.50202  ORF Transcript_21034/g.50202 Transcript_21034/m.50202 type:complete len:301 (+) Transcript_21034:111-1013(+)